MSQTITKPAGMPAEPYTALDFNISPFVVFYEVTRACDLKCAHCRACAQPNRHPRELKHEQSLELIDQIASFPKKPVFVYTGGDPLKRPDIHLLVKHTVEKGLNAAMTPSATPLVTLDALHRLHDAGLSRLAVSLDGADAETHDSFRGVGGSFQRTIEIIRDARKVGLPVQINTTITRRNVDQVDEMADLLGEMDIVLWSVFFLIPVGRGLGEQRISPPKYEVVFEKLWNHAQKQPYSIKTTEAPHYRRFVLQRAGNPLHQPAGLQTGRIQRAPIGTNDGKGVFFISHTGSVYPSGFMPIQCGKFPDQSVVDIYQNSTLLQSLRNGDLLHGKCGVCEYHHLCGGSRARSYAVTRDPLGAEPDCIYQPPLWVAQKETLACSA